MSTLAQGCTLLAPVVLAGVCHQVVRAKRWLGALNRSLDDVAFGGEEIFGANKTLRGFVVVPVACVVGFGLEAHFGLPLPPTIAAKPLACGAIVGLASMVGELPNSLLKRRLRIAPGAMPTRARTLFFVFDHLDSASSSAVAMFAIGVPWRVIATALLLGPPIHVAVNCASHAAGWRSSAW